MMLSPAAATLTTTDRREGFLAGARIGAALAARTAAAMTADAVRVALGAPPSVRPLPPPAGRSRAATALPDALLHELESGGVDLHRLAGTWVAWHERDGLDADAALIEGLAHLREFDAPPDRITRSGPSALVAVLPAALASASPRAMVSGTVHAARLLDPSPITGLTAVSLVVAAAALLDGSRDVIPDVLALLKTNQAPAEVYQRIAAVPRDAHLAPPVPRGLALPLDAATWVLWQVHQRSRSADVLEAMVTAGGVSPEVGALVGALLGARDGVGGWPAHWR